VTIIRKELINIQTIAKTAKRTERYSVKVVVSSPRKGEQKQTN
jgi:hypothetical protein